jgi:hypothetical protein
MTRRIALSAAGLGLLATIWLAAAGCSSITRDELRCEEAMSHLAGCCPGLAASPVACVGTGSFPFTAFPDVECLLDLSCEDMEAQGVCEWARTPAGKICP